MTDTSLSSLQDTLNRLDGTYGLRYANHPRVSRSLSVMSDLIAQATDVLAKLEPLGSNGDANLVAELRDKASAALDRYRAEYSAIEQAQAAGPAHIEASLLGIRANFVIWRYRRHFAGKSRDTRDLALLAEMLDDLEALQKEMLALTSAYGNLTGLQDDLGVVRSHLDLFRREADAVANAQDEGAVEEKAGRLGGLANAQFEVYRVHFAGQSRISRRPETLERVIGNLDHIEGEMQKLLTRGLTAEFNVRNLDIVRERLAAYRLELDAVRDARMDASLSDVMDGLALAVNAALQEYGQAYAGKARTDVDLVRLGELCDMLNDLERQMQNLARVTSDISDNLAVARDALGMFEREWLAIKEAQEKA